MASHSATGTRQRPDDYDQSPNDGESRSPLTPASLFLVLILFWMVTRVEYVIVLALFGLLLGILADSLALVAFGATSVAFVVVCYIGSRSRNFFEGDSYLFIAFYAVIGAWLVEVIRFFAGGAMARGLDMGYLVGAGLLNALYVAAAAVVSLIAYRAITGHR